MKKIVFIITLVIAFSAIILTSCEQNENLEENSIENNISKKKEYYIHYATWDEWGRASKKCKSWGLCNYEGCWFCCVEGGVIVDCDTESNNNEIQNAAKIIIDKETNKGFFIIELNPLIEIENIAIINKKIFYIDEDIIKENTILHQGEYKFDENVGKYGGYKLNVTTF